MSSIERQRVEGVKLLEKMGYVWDGFMWHAPEGGRAGFGIEADDMHSLLMNHAEKLIARAAFGDVESELTDIAEALKAYQFKRWGLREPPCPP